VVADIQLTGSLFSSVLAGAQAGTLAARREM